MDADCLYLQLTSIFREKCLGVHTHTMHTYIQCILLIFDALNNLVLISRHYNCGNKLIGYSLFPICVVGYDALGFEFSKPYLRAGLENDLKLICEGRRNKDGNNNISYKT